MKRWILRSCVAAAAALLLVVAALAFWPVRFESREELFEIPKGTWARRHAGDLVEILPQRVELAVGVHDVLVLKNSDDVPQLFGPTLIMPGQTFRLPFDEPSENQFSCTAHASGELTVAVYESPSTPMARLRWRTRHLIDHFAVDHP